MRTFSSILTTLLLALFVESTESSDDTQTTRQNFEVSFLQQHCFDCHNKDNAEAGFKLSELNASAESGDFDRWVEVFDRIKAGEMPPSDVSEVTDSDRKKFVRRTHQVLHERQQSEFDELGRVRGRRLNHLQLENTLHDVLGIDIPLTSQMPIEQRTDGYTSIAAGQSVSQHQLNTHLKVVDAALDEAFRRVFSEPDEWSKDLPARRLVRTNPRRRCREPEMLDGKAVVWMTNTTFYGRLPVTQARESGWYRLTLKASGLNVPKDHGVWCTVRTGRCVSSAPMLSTVSSFELSNDEREYSFTAWLPEGHMFEIRPADRTLKHARFQGGQIGAGEGTSQKVAGLAMSSAMFERIHTGAKGHVASDDDIHRLLLGDLPLRKNGSEESGKVVSKTAKKDARRLLHAFAERAFRRPVDDEAVDLYAQFVLQRLQEGSRFEEAIRSGYRAILCSPRFLYFQEGSRQLDDFAIANRMSYMLWNRPPDDVLWQLAEKRRLSDPKIRRQQAKRMLEDSRGEQFVVDLADQWLQLSEIDFTEPDRRMFPEFDIVVQDAMLKETHAFLRELLMKNLSVTNFIDSKFTFLNSRLARYYDLDTSASGQLSDDVRKVRFPKDSVRGGLMTHGAILKITANGTTTSPVIRGVWMADRLLGIHIPDPPENIPAIEPDIRGATTIREILEKHKSQASCASCHVKIDPAGFALEHFGPSGRYRETYPRPKRKSKGAPIDTASRTSDGRPFQDLTEFQALLVQNDQELAENFVRHLIAYGTGAVCEFADRDDVDQIVASSADGYGFRTLLMNVISSDLFAQK